MNNQITKKATIVTNNLSCARNNLYYAKLEKYLVLNDWEINSSFDVELIIVSGCGFHESMFDKIKKILSDSKAAGINEANIIIMGCIPKTHFERLSELYVQKVIKIGSENSLDKIIGAKVLFKDVDDINLMRLGKNNLENAKDENYFFVKIAEGCLQKCTFCIIKKSKGYIRSLNDDLILKQIKHASAIGKKNIYLVAEDTGAYGYDIGSNIIELLNSMLKIDPDFKFYFGGLHTKWIIKFSQEFRELIKKGTIHELQIGLQHTDNVILDQMGRAIDFNEFYDIIKSYKTEFPQLFIGIDIIVGFPGETEEKFDNMLELLTNDKCFDMVRHFGYSDMKDAPSFHYSEKVSRQEILKRYLKVSQSLLNRSAANKSTKDSLLANDAYQKTVNKDYFFIANSFENAASDEK